ncbi:uncharacterized protein NMK_2186 [Novimethylophilus kurashikiensis]|uniref:Uncharacterized protein n=1 Tax=Novimethylophilus kurashikiensis TaxID=1825523 RepID=A0A2R5F8R0_9PROT|nr:uncharacterized protein NMK_2186 [Novimethylophilus kurashikiensis]
MYAGPHLSDFEASLSFACAVVFMGAYVQDAISIKAPIGEEVHPEFRYLARLDACTPLPLQRSHAGEHAQGLTCFCSKPSSERRKGDTTQTRTSVKPYR